MEIQGETTSLSNDGSDKDYFCVDKENAVTFDLAYYSFITL